MRREFLRPTVMLIFGVLSYKDFLVEHGGAMLIFGIVPYMDCFFFLEHGHPAGMFFGIFFGIFFGDSSAVASPGAEWGRTMMFQANGRFFLRRASGPRHARTPMAGIPLFAQGGHGKLTPKKAARAAQNPAQNPIFCTKKTFLLALKPRFGG